MIAMPLKATRVVHKDFSSRHQPSAEGGMTATGTITRRSTAAGTLNKATGTVTNAEPTVIAAGTPARIQPATRGTTRTGISGEQIVTQYDYLVQVPANVDGVLVDDFLTIDEAPGHPQLVGIALRIAAVMHGSEGFTVDLGCREDLG